LPALTAVLRTAGSGQARPAIQAAQFLINAVVNEPVEPRTRIDEQSDFPILAPIRGIWRWLGAVDDRLGRILEMLDRLEREERAGVRGMGRV
jgi:hypothetical protein